MIPSSNTSKPNLPQKNFWRAFKAFWLAKLHAVFGKEDPEGAYLHQVSALEAAGMMLCALVVGVGCGLLAVGLNWSVEWMRHAFKNSPQGLWVILYPGLGAGAAVFFISALLKDNHGHGVPAVIKSVSVGSGRLSKSLIGSRFLGSVLTVGSGGSAGLEGPMVCIGGAWGSLIGRWLRLNERRKKLLIGYGVAAGVAGIFNAPLTGMVFALEIILGEWSYLTILPTILAALSATEISRWLAGNKITFYQSLQEFSLASLLACVVLGILTGLLSVFFARWLKRSENLFARFFPVQWLRALIGGIGVGALGYAMPEVLSEGYHIVQGFLLDPESYHHLQFVLAFLALKLLACLVTLGSGGVGGVFAPSLVLGSALGLAFGMLVQYLPWYAWAEPAAFSLVGMAGMVTGVMHGPLTGIFLVMEATRGYSLILPLMLTSCSAMLVSYSLEFGSVYTRELISRGDLIRRGTDAYFLSAINLREILDKDCISVKESLLLGDFIEVFKVAHRNYFPVIDDNKGHCLGVVFLDDIRPYLFSIHLYDLVTMGSVMRALPEIAPDEPIVEALEKFTTSGAWSLPVVEAGKFLGMLSKSTLFDHYRRELMVHTG